MSLCRPSLVLALCLLLGTAAASGSPEVDDATRNAARELGRDGVLAYQAGDYGRAVDLLRRAHALVPAPTIALYEARALVKLGRLVEAVERYEEVRRTPLGEGATPPYREAVDDASHELSELRPRVPRLKVTVAGPGHDSEQLRMQMDGKPYPRALLGVERTVDPGSREITAEVPGVAQGTQSVRIEERRSYVVTVTLSPDGGGASPRADAADGKQTSASSSGLSQRGWGWIALGAGGAGLMVGAVGAFVARDAQSTLDEQCAGTRCPPSAESDLDSLRTWRTVSLVGYGAGIVGLGVGGALLLTAPADQAPAEARVQGWVGAGSAGVRGRF